MPSDLIIRAWSLHTFLSRESGVKFSLIIGLRFVFTVHTTWVGCISRQIDSLARLGLEGLSLNFGKDIHVSINNTTSIKYDHISILDQLATTDALNHTELGGSCEEREPMRKCGKWARDEGASHFVFVSFEGGAHLFTCAK
jgi:hypothetical protein